MPERNITKKYKKGPNYTKGVSASCKAEKVSKKIKA
jgi:hypothetical protein